MSKKNKVNKFSFVLMRVYSLRGGKTSPIVGFMTIGLFMYRAFCKITFAF